MILPAIPTGISPREARFLQTCAADRRVVEFGALLGFSTVVLAQVAAAVTSIDRHEGYSGETERPYRANLDRCHVADRVRVIQGDAAAWAHLEADLAFVDLTGAYDVTKRVLQALTAPLALIHDFDRPGCAIGPAVRDAGWLPIGQVDTLLLCARAEV